MKKLLFITLLLTASANCFSAPSYKSFISSSEGKRNKVYIDSLGNKTVGIGHLLPSNYNGKEIYTEREINDLFANDLRIALIDAKFLFPSFDEQPDEVKLILVSLSFNLGRNKLSKFVKFRKAIGEKNYKSAAKELKNSLWFSQVGNRGRKYFKILNDF